MTKLHKAAQAAIDYLEHACGNRCNAEYNPCEARELANSLRAALAQEPAQDPMRSVFIHLFNAAVEEPAATPRLVNATRTARGHLFGDGKPMREDKPVLHPEVWMLQFLTDVVTSAGLLNHGGQSKALAERISSDAVRMRKLMHTAQSAQPAVQEPVDQLGIPLSCGKPLCSPGNHHQLCRLAAPQPAVQEPPQPKRLTDEQMIDALQTVYPHRSTAWAVFGEHCDEYRAIEAAVLGDAK